MFRFRHGMISSQKRNNPTDPNDPDTRPISLINAAAVKSPNIAQNPKSKSTIVYKGNQIHKGYFMQQQQPIRRQPLPNFASTFQKVNSQSRFNVYNDTNISSYSPPEVPTINQFHQKGAITKFLTIAKKYDTQPSSPIPALLESDEYGHGVHRSKEETKLVSNAFIRNFILEKTQDVQALIIQNAFRLYRKKVHWQRCIGIHVQYHIKVKKLMFLCWRLVNTIDPIKLEALFIQFSEFYDFIKNRFKIRQKAPFRLFYISGRIFLPEGYTAEVLYGFIYLMSMPTLHRIIRLWRYTSRKRINHRKSLVFIRYTSKKWSIYGRIFQFFQLWHRYAKWKNIERKSTTSDKSISLKFNEVNVLWNLLERRMNRRRVRVVRAINHSNRRVKDKSVRALYNCSISKIARSQVLSESDNFRNRHLQVFCHRAWLKFMQMRNQQTQILRDAFRAWYQNVYESAQQRFSFEMATMQQYQTKLIKIMNAWYRLTLSHKIIFTNTMMKIQANSSMALTVVFLLRGDYELFFSTLVFRMWIRFVRARKRWKSFAKWASEPDVDRERKQIILSELKRAYNLKLLRRMFVSPGSFFPRYVGFSYELTLREYLDGKRNDERMSRNRRWSFLTNELTPKADIAMYPYEVLNRCFLLRFNHIKSYDVGCNIDISSKKKITDGNPFFEKFRSFEEIETSCKKNLDLLHERITCKMARDKAILTGMVTHMSAIKTQKYIPEFTTQQTFSFVKSVAHRLTNVDQKVIVFPDLTESIAEIQKQLANNSETKSKIPYDFEKSKKMMISQFQERLRDPKEISVKKNSQFMDTLQLFGKATMGLSKEVAKNSTAEKNPLIISYQDNRNRSTSSSKSIDRDSLSSAGSLMRRNVGVAERHNEEKYFNITNLNEMLKVYNTFDLITGAIIHFFAETGGISIDLSKNNPNFKIVSISKPNEIAPKIDQSIRHKMVNNIAAFLAQLAGYSDLSKVPRRANAPDFATAAVDSILTLHAALLKTQMAQYCDQIPFSHKVIFTDHLVTETYSRLWNSMKKKFRKLELPLGLVGMMKQFGALAKAANTPMASNGSGSGCAQNTNEDTLTSKEAILACFLLPFIISFDSVKDFAKDEIVAKANRQ